MPAMVRSDKKAEKIAWNILGKPANLQEKFDKKRTQVDAKIQGEIISRDR